MRWRTASCLPLNLASIRGADHPDRTVTPLLRCNPFNGVVTVVMFIHIRKEGATRVEAPPTIVERDDVAGAREQIELLLTFHPRARLVVGRSHQNDGQRTSNVGDKQI